MTKRLFVFALLLALPLMAQAQDLERDPGYFDLSQVEGYFKVEPKIEVNIHGPLLRLVAEASRKDDPDFARLISRLRSIEVRGYPLTSAQLDDARERASQLSRQLRSRGWEPFVRVRDEGDHVDMFLKTTGDIINGMVVVVVDPDKKEAVYLNIVGNIDPEEIGRIGSHLHIEGLE